MSVISNEESLFNQLLIKGQEKLIESIKILLYKEDSDIFDKIDFEDDDIYKDPLLYAYYKYGDSSEISLDQILYGYQEDSVKPEVLNVNTDNFGRIYFSKLGWFHTSIKNQEVEFLKLEKSGFNIKLNKEDVPFVFEPCEYIEGTTIELLKYPISLFSSLYEDEKPREIEIEIISKKHKEHLTKALSFIKDLYPSQYEIIASTVKKMVVFKSDANTSEVLDNTQKNSFATLYALGCAFFNAYQENYNEVFFVDDIAHQTGHVILYNLLQSPDEVFSIDPFAQPYITSKEQKFRDSRSIYIIYHALYTYKVIVNSLDLLLRNKSLTPEKEFEALGRMKIYLHKYLYDLELLENKENGHKGIEGICTEKGKTIFLDFKKNYLEKAEYWTAKLTEFSLAKQPYNFSFSIFKELNDFESFKEKKKIKELTFNDK